jgi:hypothetical protein
MTQTLPLSIQMGSNDRGHGQLQRHLRLFGSSTVLPQ